MCDQQRLRPSCAYAQTDQSLCLSLNYYMSVKLLIELNLVFQSLTGGCTGSFESTLVKMAHCWKSHVMVQIFLNTGPRRQSVTCLATDACLTADPGVPSLIAARSYTFIEIDHEMILRSYSSLQLNHSKKKLSVISESMRSKYWFDLIHYVPSTIFQLYRDGSSWVKPVLS